MQVSPDGSYGTIDHAAGKYSLNALKGTTAIYLAWTQSAAYAGGSDQGSLTTLIAAMQSALNRL